VAHLRKLDPIEVEFTVPERYAPRIEMGQEVRFRLHSTDKIHKATVSVIEPALNEGNRTLTVRARTDNPGAKLRAGSYAQVRVAIDRIEDALTVPATALTTTSEETYVWLSEDGTAKKKVVQTGKRTENQVVVTKGLSAGDVVVTTGRQNVRPEAKLKVDTSEDAMDVQKTGPDPAKPGMRNKWFSEEPLEDEEPAAGAAATGGDDSGESSNQDDEEASP
jgi:membrane fusion protein (multidrug efflux system)